MANTVVDQSVLQKHTLAFYRLLVERSEEAQAATVVGDDGGEYPVFVGEMTKLMHYLNISSAYYSRIMNVLKTCDCIEVIQRGTAAQHSIVALKREPTAEDFTNERLTAPRRLAKLTAELEAQVQRLEAQVLSLTNNGTVNIVEVLRNHETRLNDLESRRENAT